MAIITPLLKPVPVETAPEKVSHAQLRSWAVIIYETLRGKRAVEQMGSWASPLAARDMNLQAALSKDRALLFMDQGNISPIPGRVTISYSSDFKAYCSLVMHYGNRSFAITLTLEHLHGLWRATEIFIL